MKQIAELQQKASTAAQALSSAMRDNRQRGRWGEVSLRNVVEWAGNAATSCRTTTVAAGSSSGACSAPADASAVERTAGRSRVLNDAIASL
ncbi:MAG: DNA recombination protein RmuC [Phycisphaerales bacterium]